MGSEHFKLMEGVLSIAFLVLSLGVHEAAHAWVAYKRGDTTARDEGRLTLNPISHIDPIFTILLPAVLYFTAGFIFGGAKPVPVNASRLRHPLRDMVWVALAGPGSNFLQAFLYMFVYKALLFWGGMQPDELAPRVMLNTVQFNLLLAVFNLIPIPPLDGSRVMTYLLPGPLRASYAQFERFGLLIIFGLIFLVPAFGRLLLEAINASGSFIWDLTGGSWT